MEWHERWDLIFQKQLECIRIVSRVKGQFVAKFQDKRVSEQTRIKEGKSNLNKEQKQLWEDFAKTP